MLRKLSTSLEKHFKVLNIKPGSNAEEIKSAYNKLVKLYHPDTTQISDKKVAADKFNQVHEAKNALLSSTVQKENTRSSETHSEEPHYQESVFKSYEDFKKHYEDRERYKQEEFNDKKNSNEKKSKSEWTSNPSNNENTEKFESNNYFVYAIISLILTGFYVFITQPRKRLEKKPPKALIPNLSPIHQEIAPTEKGPLRHLTYNFEGKKGPHLNFLLLSAEDDDHSVFKCKTCSSVVSKANLEDHVILANLQDKRRG